MTPVLLVRIDDAVVGRLWLDDRKRFCFRYEESWLETSRIPLSLSLPLQTEPFLDDESHSFFANLLPEARIRTVVARNLGISANNDFGLLERIGGDCAGAVTVVPEAAEAGSDASSYRLLAPGELNALIKALPQKPLLAGEEGIRLSLAGAQKKLPVLFDGEQYHLGYGSAPSNHIIKPAIEDLDGTVENEAFCMALAHAVGLAVPHSFIYEHEETKVFVVRRYDREETAHGIRRLHQEDFCQALGILPEFKYEAEGGPSLKGCFNLVRRFSVSSGRDARSLLDWVIFNYLIGNSDAHGKNVSLLLLQEGPVLAPFYDLLSIRIYAHYGVSETLAMRIGGENDPRAIQKRHWELLAEEVKIKPRFVLGRVAEVAQAIQAKRLELFKGPFDPYRCDALYRLMELIDGQCERTLRGLR